MMSSCTYWSFFFFYTDNTHTTYTIMHSYTPLTSTSTPQLQTTFLEKFQLILVTPPQLILLLCSPSRQSQSRTFLFVLFCYFFIFLLPLPFFEWHLFIELSCVTCMVKLLFFCLSFSVRSKIFPPC